MQLPLNLDLIDPKTLSNFCWQGNEILQSQLQLALNKKGERFFYLWGETGTGKSHLLQGLTEEQLSGTIYLPLKQLTKYGAEIFDGIEQLELVCIDDIEEIAGIKHLEEGLFHLYNRIRDNQTTQLVIAGSHSLGNLPIHLPDLRSRIAWGLVFQLSELSEKNKLEVITQQALSKGFNLPETVGNYLISHCARDMNKLSEIIDTLDKASLVAKRKLTIPFVKECLKL